MAKKDKPKRERQRERPPPLAADRCPQCDGPLQVIKDQPERLCPKCGIYIEVLQPLSPTEPSPESGQETVAPRREIAKMHLGFEALDDFSEKSDSAGAEGEPRPAEAAAPSTEGEQGREPSPAGAPPTEPAPAEPELKVEPIFQEPESSAVLPPVEEPKALPSAEATPTPPEGEAAQPPPPAVDLPPPPPPTELPAPPEPPQSEAVTEPTESQEVQPPEVPAEVEAAPQPEGEAQAAPVPVEARAVERYECPRCGATVDAEAKVCPKCGAIFDASVLSAGAMAEVAVVDEAVPTEAFEPQYVEVAEPQVAAVARAAVRAERVAKPSLMDRAIFYIGALNIALGGSGLILGSFLHDFFRVPYVGYAYDSFGSLNMTAVLFGAVFLAAGALAMAIGARHGAGRKGRAAGG